MDHRASPIYGLDIETDTSVDGLDPAVAPVVTVALSTPGGDEVFTGAERALLAALDDALVALPPGVIATWNGAAFDLPFLADRYARHGLAAGLTIELDPSIVSRRPPLAGHEGAYRAGWHGHGHIDAYRLYRGDVGPALRVSCSLKTIARLVGLTPVEVDREQIHALPDDVLRSYVTSDARLARQLTERRWPAAARFIDNAALFVTHPDECPVRQH
jgi:DNA polymerase elongation subunit (family B)